MKILVTGATGCVGSELMPELKGDVSVFSRHATEGKKTKAGDITDAAAVEKAVKGMDVVYHIAGLVDYSNNRELLNSINLKGTENVLNACQKHGVGRLIYTSTVGVYGRVDSFPIDESTQANPETEYARSKYAAECLVTGQKGTPWTVLRPAPVYGPKSKQFAYLIRKISEGKLSMIGNGSNKNHMVNSHNLAQALVLSQKKAAENQLFVIADEKAYTAKEIYGTIIRLLGAAPKRPVPYPLAYAFALLNEIRGKELNRNYLRTITQHREYSIRKAKDALGYKPKVELENGMRELVEWCREEGIIGCKSNI